MLMTRSAVSTEYRRATGGQTKGQTACHGIVRAMHTRRVVKTEHIFFTNKKNLYLNPPIYNQNGRMWAGGRKDDVEPHHLINCG